MARYKVHGYYIVYDRAISVDLELIGFHQYHHIHFAREKEESEEHMIGAARAAGQAWANQFNADIEVFKVLRPRDGALILTPPQIDTIFRAGVSAGESSAAAYNAGSSMHGSVLDYLENALVWDGLLPEVKDLDLDAKHLWWSIFKTAMGRDGS